MDVGPIDVGGVANGQSVKRPAKRVLASADCGSAPDSALFVKVGNLVRYRIGRTVEWIGHGEIPCGCVQVGRCKPKVERFNL